jgi:hypothetical protein
MIARAFDGKPEGLTPDDVPDNITLYWLKNTAEGVSETRLYSQHDKSTHFAAWEKPADFTADLRAAFKTLR